MQVVQDLTVRYALKSVSIQRSPRFGPGAGTWTDLVAAADTELDLSGGGSVHTAPTDQLFALDRAEIAITVHSRAAVHTVELADLRTHERWEFEANRLTSHLKSLLAELHDILGGS